MLQMLSDSQESMSIDHTDQKHHEEDKYWPSYSRESSTPIGLEQDMRGTYTSFHMVNGSSKRPEETEEQL
jgi:hypothetical protein